MSALTRVFAVGVRSKLTVMASLCNLRLLKGPMESIGVKVCAPGAGPPVSGNAGLVMTPHALAGTLRRRWRPLRTF